MQSIVLGISRIYLTLFLADSLPVLICDYIDIVCSFIQSLMVDSTSVSSGMFCCFCSEVGSKCHKENCGKLY